MHNSGLVAVINPLKNMLQKAFDVVAVYIGIWRISPPIANDSLKIDKAVLEDDVHLVEH